MGHTIGWIILYNNLPNSVNVSYNSMNNPTDHKELGWENRNMQTLTFWLSLQIFSNIQTLSCNLHVKRRKQFYSIWIWHHRLQIDSFDLSKHHLMDIDNSLGKNSWDQNGIVHNIVHYNRVIQYSVS